MGGLWHKPSHDLQPLVSPANEQTITHTALPTIQNADDAAQLARHAFDPGPWARLSIDERVGYCARLYDEITRTKPSLSVGIRRNR